MTDHTSNDHPSNENWTDGYGVAHAGAPPVGYWIASDGRWYPPELAQGAPTAAPGPESAVEPEPSAVVGDDPSYGFDAPAPAPSYAAPFGGPPSAAPPGDAFAPPSGGPAFAPPSGGPTGVFSPGEPASSGDDSKKLFMMIGAAVVGVLILAGGAFAVFGGGGDDSGDVIEAAEGVTSTTIEGAEAGTETETTEAGTETTEAATEATATETTETTAVVAAGGSDVAAVEGTAGAEGIVCAPISGDEYVLDVTNGGGTTSDYWLTVAFFDASGSRIGDSAAWIDSVRPGERALETQWSGEEGWSTCEVLDADVNETQVDTEALADVGACTVSGADFAGDVAGDVSVTNNGSAAADYILDIALIDPQGLRRGATSTSINQVRPGETAPGDVYTWVEFEEGFTCEVISVSRYES